MHESADLSTGVVAAALELFSAQGFDQTSVEQIAKAAGVSRSTFFRQFGGKEDVVFIDHEALLDELRQLAEDGVVTLRVAESYSPGDAGRAHERLEAGGTRGRLVIDFTR